MNKENTPVQAFYDSEEDYCWGPVTIREIKRDLKRTKKLDPKFRRQTASFIPLPTEENSKMFTANSTQSSKDYQTANESLESRTVQIPEDNPENAPTFDSNVNSSKMSSDKFISINSDKEECNEVYTLSSDSEDDHEIPATIDVKRERFSRSQDTSFKSLSSHAERMVDDVICLSSSDDEALNRSENVSGISLQEDDEDDIQEVTSDKSGLKIPKINIICVTPKKRQNYFSRNYPADHDFSLTDEKTEENHNVSTQVSSSEECSELRHESSHELVLEDEKSETENEQKIDVSSQISSSNVYEECIDEEISDNAVTSSSNCNEFNRSQKENEYVYCEETNQTLSKDHSSHISGIFDGSHCIDQDELELHHSPNDSMESLGEDLENCTLNDTFAEMQKFLNEGLESDSDDSYEDFIGSTPSKISKSFSANLSGESHSKIPVLISYSGESSSSAGLSEKCDFKVPKSIPKVAKKTPVSNKFAVPKTSPSPLKDIVSPVRIYIKNSPFASLKRSHKSQVVQSCQTIGNNPIIEFLPHRNILSSLPEVVYKPSVLVEKKTDAHIILPKNIKSLIVDRTVIKHEPRKRINFDETIFSVEEKLEMGDISHIVSDEHNMSVHTIKQGLNL